ncbi:hypothetical protein SAZ10_11365 [Mesorhizobium sp. BAC0120]|uniref:hypothetical protein n=1 Tax=Mesorhizobium sp. BAC0120 TaxID=3090670 RepID=UPI00298BD5CD|nr:hypothetical protein [Mesorhizobium sp. BAC0120]MDW6022352.1 hypothetical protein [Mesorhizobium sp. BAC0120]
MRKVLAILAPLAILAFALPAEADAPGVAAAALSAKTVAARSKALSELESQKAVDPLAAYAAGAVEFLVALEKLGAGLHRHGFESPQSFIVPLMRLPIPENPNPEPLTYESFRQILVDFHDAMAQSAASLAMVPKDADIGVVVDLANVGIDLNEDGSIAPDETIAAIIASLANGGTSPPDAPPALVFRFDRADGYWLQGYANFLMAQTDFWLAHDFHLAFDQSFQMLFPKAKLPMQDTLVPPDNGASSIFASEWRIADFISYVHLINWPVVEPERRKAARRELLETIRLSREDWKAIRAEKDNDREWLPGPQQDGTNQLTGLKVTEQEVRAWHTALQMAEDLLEGRKLLPHFRFADKGINMKRFFDEPRTFDLVLSITGPGIVPYLEKGPIISSAEWSALQQQFGRVGFLTFALWAN